MIRILNGVAYEVKSADSFRVRAHDLGHGHLEVTAVRERVAVELEWTADQIRDHKDMMERYREECAEEIAQRHAQRSASRARNKVRRLCKAAGFDTLITNTYRLMQDDLDLCKRHVKEFNRRVLRVWPSFRCVAIYEPQERGAWHVHMATNRVPKEFIRNGVKLKSFNLLRAIWRSVTKEYEGTVNVSAHKRNSKRSPAKIAAYLAKYLGKAFLEGVNFKNRYGKYGDFDVPPPMDLGRVATLRDALEVTYSLAGDAYEVETAKLDRFKDWFLLHAYAGGKGADRLCKGVLDRAGHSSAA